MIHTEETISVLMSVYKKERPEFLNEALNSVWTAQSVKPNQIVLVEDGVLTDGLYSVILDWKSKLGEVLTLVTNTTNLGLTKSLNIGVTYVTSSLIARMDSDDRSASDRFKKQRDFLSSHPDIDIVGGTLQEFDDNNPCLNLRHYPQSHKDVVAMIHKACPLAHPTVMMRTNIFRDGNLHYDERYRTSQDIALWYDAIFAGHRIANIPDVTVYFRRSGDVYKRRSKAKAWNEFKIYCKGIKRLYGLFTLKYVYPFARLLFRLMPIIVVKWGYNSSLRKRVAE